MKKIVLKIWNLLNIFNKKKDRQKKMSELIESAQKLHQEIDEVYKKNL